MIEICWNLETRASLDDSRPDFWHASLRTQTEKRDCPASNRCFLLCGEFHSQLELPPARQIHRAEAMKNPTRRWKRDSQSGTAVFIPWSRTSDFLSSMENG